jgi:hypothetical protein
MNYDLSRTLWNLEKAERLLAQVRHHYTQAVDAQSRADLPELNLRLTQISEAALDVRQVVQELWFKP